jgi:hypothetical protein
MSGQSGALAQFARRKGPNSCARDRARPLVVRDDGVVLRDADTGVAKAENRL